MRLALAAALTLAAAPATATTQMEVGSSEFIFSSDLMAEGAEPFPAAGGNAVYGLRRDSDLFLCFLADTPQLQGRRQQVLLGMIAGTSDTRELPNIPVVCVLTQ